MAGAYPFLGRRYGTRRAPGLAGTVMDVSKLFATSLYTGTGSAQTITNGIDLAGKGGLVREKGRNAASSHRIADTARGSGNLLDSSSTAAEAVATDYPIFGSSGYSSPNGAWASGKTVASWSFAQDPRFFKVITYTGNGTTQVIPHGLAAGVSVGMVVIKRRDIASTAGWPVWHRSLTTGNHLLLNAPAGQVVTNASNLFGNNTTTVDPTASGVTVGSNADVNAATGSGPGGTAIYVMEVFADDTASDGVIRCGSGNVTLPFVPQYVEFKDAGAVSNWFTVDSARGFSSGIQPNTTAAEATQANLAVSGSTLTFTGMTTPIWTAIRAP